MRHTVFVALLLFAFHAMAQESAAPPAGVVHKHANIAAANDEWASTGIRTEPGGILVVMAEGQIALSGSMSSRPDAGEFKYVSTGCLIGKIGTEGSFRVGSSFASKITTGGLFKLKVHDNQHSDNSGAYAVTIIYLPPASLPIPDPVPEPE